MIVVGALAAVAPTFADALLPDAIELTIGGHVIRLLGLAKIVEIKRMSTRPKDVQMLPILEETLRRR